MDHAALPCPRRHFEDHHVRMLQALRKRAELLQEDLDKAAARLAYVSDQLDSLMADAAVPR